MLGRHLPGLRKTEEDTGMGAWLKVWMPVGIAALLVSVVVIGSGSALAGKGGRAQGESSIVLNEPAANTSADAVSWPRLGDSVSFTTVAAGLAGWEYPMVAVWCYQDGVLAYMELATPETGFVLGGGSSDWRTNGGAADCEAYLYAYGSKGGQESIRPLAGTSFANASP
jgi:hypothetical protein